MRGCSALGKTFKQADQGNVGRAASHLHASGFIVAAVALCECVCLFVGLFFGLGFCCCCCFSESAHWSFLELQSQFFPYDVIQAGFLPGQKRYFWKPCLLNAIRAITCTPPVSFQWWHIAFSLALRQGHEQLFPLLPFLHHTDGTCQAGTIFCRKNLFCKPGPSAGADKSAGTETCQQTGLWKDFHTLSTNQKWSLMGETFQLSKIARARMVFVTGTGVQITAACKPTTDSYCSNGSNFSSSYHCSWTFFARPQLICFSLALACIPHVSCEAEPNARDLKLLLETTSFFPRKYQFEIKIHTTPS